MTAHASLESPPPLNARPSGPAAIAFWEIAFDALAQGVTVQDAHGRLVFANQAAAQMLGFSTRRALLETPSEALLATFELFDADGQPMALARLPNRRALREQAVCEDTVVFRERATGLQRTAVIRAQPILEGGVLTYVVNTFRDITQQERIEAGLRFLAEASRILASSLDTDKTLEAVARLAVPHFADWCAIELVEEGQTVGRQVAVAHVDPAKVSFARELRDRYPPRADSPNGVPNVIRTGQPELYEEIPDALLVQGAIDAEHLRISRELGLRSAVVVPLSARGRVLGALTLVYAESNRRYTQADLGILMELASRAGVAVDNALLFQGARQSEQRAVLALEAGRLGAWEWNIRTGKVTWSESLERIQGLAPGTFAGTLESAGANVHPEDRERLSASIAATVQRGVTHRLEYRIVRPDGEVRWLESSGQLTLGEDGAPLKVTGVSGDITERRMAEETRRRLTDEQRQRELAQAGQERIERVLDSITDPFVALDADWRISFLNTAAAASLGLSRQLLIGKRLEELDASEDTQRFLEQCRRAREENRPRQFEHFVARQSAWFTVHAYPFEGGVSLYSRDVTARRQAEEALARHTDELARSNAELERFAYVASHDLQEPLRMVASYTQLLARRYQGKLDQDADDFIHFAVDGVTRMQQLINDLLAYSRVGTRGKEFQPVEVDRVVDRALLNLEFALKDSGATVTRTALPTVIGDESQLAQLFQNLLGNALKFRGSAPPKLDISAEREDAGWHFRVKDNGIGIEPAYFERIFVIFQRLHAKGDYPGTGIGLAICKKIVERHGGRIWVESAPDVGSVFHFLLPQKPTPPAGGRLL